MGGKVVVTLTGCILRRSKMDDIGGVRGVSCFVGRHRDHEERSSVGSEGRVAFMVKSEGVRGRDGVV